MLNKMDKLNKLLDKLLDKIMLNREMSNKRKGKNYE